MLGLVGTYLKSFSQKEELVEELEQSELLEKRRVFKKWRKVREQERLIAPYKRAISKLAKKHLSIEEAYKVRAVFTAWKQAALESHRQFLRADLEQREHQLSFLYSLRRFDHSDFTYAKLGGLWTLDLTTNSSSETFRSIDLLNLSVESFDISRARATRIKEGLMDFIERHPEIRELSCFGQYRLVSNGFLRKVLKALPNLTYINLSVCNKTYIDSQRQKAGCIIPENVCGVSESFLHKVKLRKSEEDKCFDFTITEPPPG